MDSKIKFYIGNVTDGGVDGVAATSAQCLFPLVYRPSDSSKHSTMVRVPIIFALRCDPGYQAVNVVISFDTKLQMGCVQNDYSSFNHNYNSISNIKVGTVTNVNKVIKLYSGFYPEYAVKIYVSYTEVKI